jgi:hypothetical protein
MLFTFPIPQLLLLKKLTESGGRKTVARESGKVSIDGMAGTH